MAIRLVIKKKGVEYVLKMCVGCGDEWYAKRKQNRCTLCGSGLVRLTPEDIDRNWDELRGRAKVSGEVRAFEAFASRLLRETGGGHR